MTHVETAGTFSCSHISIGWFKNQKDANEKYKADKIKTQKPAGKLDCKEFYTKILYPVAQEQGKTYDMPFEELMEQIGGCMLKSKMITAVINHSQFMQDNQYWPTQLKNHGFKLVKKTGNTIGMANYLFIRDPLGVALTEEEKVWA